tara:strand:+ start:64 stop:624 length:561 start_codon:yes stop_codon:yes gene_type:complete
MQYDIIVSFDYVGNRNSKIYFSLSLSFSLFVSLRYIFFTIKIIDKQKLLILAAFFGLGGENTGHAAESTGSSRGDKTNLLTRRRVTTNSRGVTNVLVVTTTVGMLYWVHRNTSHLRPRVAFHSVLVVRGTRLQQGLIASTTARDLTNGRSAPTRNRLFRARRQFNSRKSSLQVVGDQDAVFARSLG